MRSSDGLPVVGQCRAWADEGSFWEGREGWGELDTHMTRIKEEWQTPNGDEIEHAIHTF
ncbi:MAG: hypothetical protein IIA27_16635, partial [Gemmatimonadetes bacterium]|nr:hypothetical protein [Gemmatimonadota bacterium]